MIALRRCLGITAFLCTSHHQSYATGIVSKFDKIWAVYFSTGAFGTATPTKFALDRSTTGTPVKSQLALTPNVSSSNLAVKSEVTDDKAAHETGVKGEEDPPKPAEEDVKSTEDTEEDMKPSAEAAVPPAETVDVKQGEEVQLTTTSREVSGETRGTADATEVKAEPEPTSAAEATINTGELMWLSFLVLGYWRPLVQDLQYCGFRFFKLSMYLFLFILDKNEVYWYLLQCIHLVLKNQNCHHTPGF